MDDTISTLKFESSYNGRPNLDSLESESWTIRFWVPNRLSLHHTVGLEKRSKSNSPCPKSVWKKINGVIALLALTTVAQAGDAKLKDFVFLRVFAR